MVLKPVRYTGEDFDRYVRGLISDWEFALELRDEWHTLDGEEHAAYTEDWPVNNDIHQHLADYVAEHELTEEQQAQWDKLNKLVAEHKADLEEMGYRVRIPDLKKGEQLLRVPCLS